MNMVHEDDDFLSDESSFFGDDDLKAEYEKRAAEVGEQDIQDLWDLQSRSINFIAASKRQNSKSTKSVELVNPYDGNEAARQLGETVEQFLHRIPPVHGPDVGPWIWIANPYGTIDSHLDENSSNYVEFKQRALRLLDEFDRKKRNLEGNPDWDLAIVMRKLKADTENLKHHILDLATDCRIVCGKWLLFTAVEDVSRIWPPISYAVAEGKLGISAKISTDATEQSRLICVYTRDFNDKEDVHRVVKTLREIGVLPKDSSRSIYYKCDAYTYLGIDSKNQYGLAASLYASKEFLSPKGLPLKRSMETESISNRTPKKRK